MRAVQLETSWLALLADQFDQPYMLQLREFLLAEKLAGKTVYPSGNSMFAALNRVPVEQVKVVVIGQDPYHGENQAHGLCFSVQKGFPLPSSLKNIYRENNHLIKEFKKKLYNKFQENDIDILIEY